MIDEVEAKRRDTTRVTAEELYISLKAGTKWQPISWKRDADLNKDHFKLQVPTLIVKSETLLRSYGGKYETMVTGNPASIMLFVRRLLIEYGTNWNVVEEERKMKAKRGKIDSLILRVRSRPDVDRIARCIIETIKKEKSIKVTANGKTQQIRNPRLSFSYEDGTSIWILKGSIEVQDSNLLLIENGVREIDYSIDLSELENPFLDDDDFDDGDD